MQAEMRQHLELKLLAGPRQASAGRQCLLILMKAFSCCVAQGWQTSRGDCGRWPRSCSSSGPIGMAMTAAALSHRPPALCVW